MSDKTIFQKIIDREIPAPLVYEDELVAAFNDMARSAAFEQHWANKFKKSHMVVVVIALVVLPALLGLLLFRN